MHRNYWKLNLIAEVVLLVSKRICRSSKIRESRKPFPTALANKREFLYERMNLFFDEDKITWLEQLAGNDPAILETYSNQALERAYQLE